MKRRKKVVIRLEFRSAHLGHIIFSGTTEGLNIEHRIDLSLPALRYWSYCRSSQVLLVWPRHLRIPHPSRISNSEFLLSCPCMSHFSALRLLQHIVTYWTSKTGSPLFSFSLSLLLSRIKRCRVVIFPIQHILQFRQFCFLGPPTSRLSIRQTDGKGTVVLWCARRLSIPSKPMKYDDDDSYIYFPISSSSSFNQLLLRKEEHAWLLL